LGIELLAVIFAFYVHGLPHLVEARAQAHSSFEAIEEKPARRIEEVDEKLLR
jgi:hypothetical protein